jgi:hypothetical protein
MALRLRFAISRLSSARRVLSTSAAGGSGDDGEWDFDDDWLDAISQRDVSRGKASRFGRALKQGSARRKRMAALEQRLDGASAGGAAASNEPFARLGVAKIRADRLAEVRAHFHDSVVTAYGAGVPNGFVAAHLFVDRASPLADVLAGVDSADEEDEDGGAVTIRSLTLWDDEASLVRASATPEYAAAMKAFGGMLTSDAPTTQAFDWLRTRDCAPAEA